ncbi:MAG: hypothetical protein FJ288_02290 [Planctomycetes bacterium]|nr:hypothetical protein [Planctomycetota bacterium]
MTVVTELVQTQAETLHLVADVALAAGSPGKPPTVSVLAYTGGLMRVPGWGDVVVDLAGLDVTGPVAILSDHDSTRRGIVGHGQAEVAGNQVLVNGSISATTVAAKEVVDAARNGFPWQASVGVEVLEFRRVAGGAAVAVNGRTIKAPAGGLALVTKGRLREVSLVALGCDLATRVAVAASGIKKGNRMETQVQEVKDQQTLDAAEAQRAAAVKRICGARHVDIEARATAEGWDESRTELEVLRAERPKVPAVIIPTTMNTAATIEAAILAHMGRATLGEKMLGAVAMEQAEYLGATCLLDLCRTALVVDGVEVPRGKMEMVKAALSTMLLPTALGNVANKVLLDAYTETPATWRSFAAIRNVPDFKTNAAIRPSFTVPLMRIAPGGELKHGTVGESTIQYAIDTFGRILSVDRRDIINDDLGVFEDASAAEGRAAMRSLSDLVYEVLLANAAGFFSVENGNYMLGADSALTFDGLAKAITLMRTQRDAAGNDLDVRPATLVVGPELETTARALLASEFIQQAVGVPTGNSLRQAVGLEVEPRLSNTTKFGNAASNKHWYLMAAPSASPMVVAFLNGRQTPMTEYFGLEQSVERLAVSWRVYFDYGAALCDPRAAVRSKGQA